MDTFFQLFRLLVPPLFVLLVVVVSIHALGPVTLPLLAGTGLWLLYRLVCGEQK